MIKEVNDLKNTIKEEDIYKKMMEARLEYILKDINQSEY